MAAETLKAELTETRLIDIKGRLSKTGDKFIAKCVLVNCSTREHVVEIEFFKSRNYRCDALIRIEERNIYLNGSARGDSKTEALMRALEKIGVKFNIELWHFCRDHFHATPVESAIDAIADALEILPDNRTRVLAEAEDINAR